MFWELALKRLWLAPSQRMALSNSLISSYRNLCIQLSTVYSCFKRCFTYIFSEHNTWISHHRLSFSSEVPLDTAKSTNFLAEWGLGLYLVFWYVHVAFSFSFALYDAAGKQHSPSFLGSKLKCFLSQHEAIENLDSGMISECLAKIAVGYVK